MPFLLFDFCILVIPPNILLDLHSVLEIKALNIHTPKTQLLATRKATRLFFQQMRWKKMHLTADGSKHESWCVGDKAQRRRNDREEKAASTAALLQHVIGDPKFGKAVQELESSFGAKFSDFITGQHCSLQPVPQRKVNCVLACGCNKSSRCGLHGSINFSWSPAFYVVLLNVSTLTVRGKAEMTAQDSIWLSFTVQNVQLVLDHCKVYASCLQTVAFGALSPPLTQYYFGVCRAARDASNSSKRCQGVQRRVG